MKIAVCFSGQLRTGVESEPSIKRYLGNLLPNCDFFVHTWDKQSHPQRQQTGEFESLDLSLFSEFYDLYQPLAMVVEPYAPYQAPPGVWGGFRVDPKTGRKTISMFESIYKANRLKSIYESDINFVYDYVLRARTDLIFHPDKSVAADIEELELRRAQSRHPGAFVSAFHQGHHAKLEDIFWIAPSETMNQLCEFYQVRADSGRDDDWQWHMAEWVRSQLNIPFYPLVDSRICLMRVEQRDLDPLNFNLFSVK